MDKAYMAQDASRSSLEAGNIYGRALGSSSSLGNRLTCKVGCSLISRDNLFVVLPSWACWACWAHREGGEAVTGTGLILALIL